MKKIINKPEDFVEEMLEGIVMANPDMYKLVDSEKRAFIRKNIIKDKVAIVTGGGSGHLPVFLGYVGDNMLDGCAVGNVFASPSSNAMYEAAKAVHAGKGILYLFGNYGGDTMNFEMAKDMLDFEDIQCELIKVSDDVASAPKGEEYKRRGVAGIFFAYKIAGAAASEGKDLSEVVEVTNKALESVRTMGVALSSCIIPEVGKPTFEIADDEMEIGMGIHGEPGIKRGKLQTADEIAEIFVDRILEDYDYKNGDEVAVLVNGLGATPKEELFILYKKINCMLTEKGIKVYRAYIGEYATSMEMAGSSLTLMKLDDELKRYLDKEVKTGFFEQLGK